VGTASEMCQSLIRECQEDYVTCSLATVMVYIVSHLTGIRCNQSDIVHWLLIRHVVVCLKFGLVLQYCV